MNQNDYYNNIEKWLQTLSLDFLKKINHVLSTLKMLWKLRDSNIIDCIPLENFYGDNYLRKDEVITILKILYEKDIINITKSIGFAELTFADDAYIVEDLNTVLEIFLDKFNYLSIYVDNLIHPDSISVRNDKINWLDSYQWITELEFSFGNNRLVKFSKVSSTRIKIFKFLTEAKGEYVTIAAMEQGTGKARSYIRTVIGQLKKEILTNTGFTLAPNQTGSYRLERTSSL